MTTVAASSIVESGDIAPPSAAPSRRKRMLAALAIGIGSGLFAAAAFLQQGAEPDFSAWYHAAHALIAGANPYKLPLGSPAWPFDERFYYPLPAALLTVPFALLPLPMAGAAFMGISGGLLAWLVTRDGLWRLWIFGTASYFMACKVGQWSPVVTAVAFLPAAGFLAAMKPNLGLALLSYRPTWRAILGCVVVGLISFAVLPSWLVDWHTNTAALVGHPSPIFTPLGAVLLLALLRWRRPETRLLLAMACVPQLLFFADQLPLFLIARTRREMNALTMCSAAGCFAWYVLRAHRVDYVLAAAPYVLCSTYLPCLIMVLRRPNEGEVPQWLEQASAVIVQVTWGRLRARRAGSNPQ